MVAWVSMKHLVLHGEMSLDLSREHCHPVLKVTNYDEGGRIQKYGLWARAANGEWRSQSL
jgi:hypothetical protein